MSDAGIVIRQEDASIQAKAAALGVGVTVSEEWSIPYPRTLIASRASIPWDLLDAGLHFLDHWDAAAPLWKYGVLAQDLGTPAERTRTEEICLDLRIPVYAPELLFVRQSPAANKLLWVWREECAMGDERLAFLRALCLVKPIFCALPTLWLKEINSPSALPLHLPKLLRPSATGGLVRVQIAPGVTVQCFASEADKMVRRLQRNRQRRAERKANADHD